VDRKADYSLTAVAVTESISLWLIPDNELSSASMSYDMSRDFSSVFTKELKRVGELLQNDSVKSPFEASTRAIVVYEWKNHYRDSGYERPESGRG